MGIADRVHDLPCGQPPHIPQIGARQIGAVNLCHTQISTAEIGAVFISPASVKTNVFYGAA